jgi:PAS domain S-box-containing protein
MIDSPGRAGRTRGPKRILLVEDEAIIALSESHMLSGKGYAVEIAASGEAALEAIDGGRFPDLILMDIDLGTGMDGTAAAREILSRRKIPIVFLSSRSTKEMVGKVRGITRYGIIVKGSSDFVILSTIEMALELFEKETILEEKNLLMRRAEKALGMGYWCASPGESTISLSGGAMEILGMDSDVISFDDFRRLVHPDSDRERSEAFRALIDEGRPYDITYGIKRVDTGARISLRSSGRARDGVALGVLQDVTAAERLLGDLRLTEERRAVTLRSIGDGVIATDTDGKVVELNPAAEALTGWSSAEAAGRAILEVFPIVNAATLEPVENPVKKVIESGRVVGLANHTVLITRDGKRRHIADSAAPIKDDSGTLFGMVLVFRDVTAEYEADEESKRAAEMFRTLFTESHTPMLLIDRSSGSIREANRAAERFYGWEAAELRTMNISRINTLEPEQIAREMELAERSGRAEFRFVHRLADGETRPVLVVSGPVRVNGERFLLSIVHDATGARAEERRLREERERSEILLKDARHRMKNNVQMLSSLVSLHLASVGEGMALDALGKLQDRIAGMSLVYERLQWLEGRENLGSGEYLSSLLRALGTCYLPASIELKERIEDSVLDAKLAVSIGIIVVELVTNSCKHAFPSGRAGIISVGFSRAADGSLNLAVRDDGIGMDQGPFERDGDRREGIGLALIGSLVEQEGGEMRTSSAAGGTSVTCVFPERR